MRVKQMGKWISNKLYGCAWRGGGWQHWERPRKRISSRHPRSGTGWWGGNNVISPSALTQLTQCDSRDELMLQDTQGKYTCVRAWGRAREGVGSRRGGESRGVRGWPGWGEQQTFYFMPPRHHHAHVPTHTSSTPCPHCCMHVCGETMAAVCLSVC